MQGHPASAVKNASSALERRRSPRRPHAVEAYVTSPTATDPDERIAINSLNLSRHGVCFHCRQALPTGTFYRIDLTTGPQHSTCEVRIVSCRESEGGFAVGAQFC